MRMFRNRDFHMVPYPRRSLVEAGSFIIGSMQPESQTLNVRL
jgi:hypothetical protein